MQPHAWAQNPINHIAAARRSFESLASALTAAGAQLEITPGVAGLPDMVFPANAAIVLDRLALLARFRHAERRGEEQHLQECFRALMSEGFSTRSCNSRQTVFRKGQATASGTLPAA